MNPRYIAAIEIGSSRIKGIVAAVDDTSAIKVLAIEEADSADSVRYGRVLNAREAGTRINDIIRRLENNPTVAPASIAGVVIAEGGRSLSHSHADATINFGGEAEITPQTLERLHKEARYNLATDRDVLAISQRRFVVDSAEVKKIVGAFGKEVHGEFTFVTVSPENRRAVERCNILSGDTPVKREYITRLVAQTEMALTDSDRQLGCLFIDFGAETTTLAIYRNGALQAATVLPMGSANITRDLANGLSTTIDNAENIKVTKGHAVAERVALQTDDETREIINFVSARASEIIANISNFIQSAGFKPSELTAGAVLTGGGSRLDGFREMLEAQTRLKVRPAAVDSSIAVSTGHNPADVFDLIALVKFAAGHTSIECLSFPRAEAEAAAAATQATPATTPAAAPAPQPAAPAYQYSGYAGRRTAPALNDPALLMDDMDEDEPIEQPDNINDDPNIDDIPQESTPEATRKKLLQRLKDWIAPKVDDVDN